MATAPDIRWSRLKVGVIVVATVATLLLLLFFANSGAGVFARKLTVTSYFEDAYGLKPGAAVNLEGVAIGTVKSVELTNAPEHKKTPVEVVMKLDSRHARDLHTDSIATITTEGVLGDTMIDIANQVSSGVPLKNGDELKTIRTPSLQDEMHAGQKTADSLKKMLGTADVVVDRIQSGKGSIGQFINNPKLNRDSDGIQRNMQEFNAKLNGNNNTAGRLLSAGANDMPLQDTANKLNELASDVRTDKRFNDPALRQRLSEAKTNTASLLSDINAGKGSVGLLVKDPAFAKNLKNTITNTDALMTSVNDGGKFVSYKDAGASLAKLEAESNTLATMIRKNPRKYLTIQFRIF